MPRNRPLIGIPAAGALDDFPDYISIRASYCQAIQRAGGIPLIIPPMEDPRSLEKILGMVAGLLLPGGADVLPSRYGEETHATSAVNGPLDVHEFAVVAWALERGLPILGVCRGQQVLNVALGGSLIQDLRSCGFDTHAHSTAGRGELVHPVYVDPTSKLAQALGADSLWTNSLHHQAIARLGQGLRVVAWSGDDLVEGIESQEQPWLLAVQFHPEELIHEDGPSQRLFAAFVRTCESETVKRTTP